MPFPKPSRPPTFTPLWKKPGKMIAAWPPLGAAGFHDLCWDVIIFNFRTDDAEEVNWYFAQFHEIREDVAASKLANRLRRP